MIVVVDNCSIGSCPGDRSESRDRLGSLAWIQSGLERNRTGFSEIRVWLRKAAAVTFEALAVAVRGPGARTSRNGLYGSNEAILVRP